MKTAISIPDDVFEVAERLARRTKKSRSRLFSDAIGEYVARHAARATGLAKDSVANVSQIVTLDRGLLTEFVNKLASANVILGQ